MDSRKFSTLGLIGAAMCSGPALAQQVAGKAVVMVEAEPPGMPDSFVFTGAPSGTVTPGDILVAEGLRPGGYESVESARPPGLELVAIACDDGASPNASEGDLGTRTATFNLDPGETVVCSFRYSSAELAEGTGPAGPGSPGTAGPGDASAPDGPGGCAPPGPVPREGRWDVSNLPGSMVCGSMINMPLKPSRETGILEVQDCGWTVVGTGLAEDTAPLTMHAVEGAPGRYSGSVGGVQDGIPMTIHFTWQLQSEESITGDLESEVSQQGVTCRMTRPFELRYAGP